MKITLVFGEVFIIPFNESCYTIVVQYYENFTKHTCNIQLILREELCPILMQYSKDDSKTRCIIDDILLQLSRQ